MLTEPRQLSDFEGRWRVSRRIRPREGPGARFEGHAEWTDAQAGLIYRETGTMTLEGQIPMQAERRYLWTPELAVHFDDGRFFHRVPPVGGATDHWCDPDTYRGRYEFDSWPFFRVTWQVTGPRKDYLSITEYTPC
jgi:hypothetical protein